MSRAGNPPLTPAMPVSQQAVSDMWHAAGRGRRTDAAAADVDALAALYRATFKALQGVYTWSRGKEPYEVDPIVEAHAED